METKRHDAIERDLKALRRFPAARASLDAWERLYLLKGLHETPAIDQVPGFHARKIYKGRVVPLRENLGKTKGYRVVFEVLDKQESKVLLFSRHGIYKNEQELIMQIRERLRG